MGKLLLPNKPRINDAETDLLAKYIFGDKEEVVTLMFVRGYFSNTIGGPGNDFNRWDDAAIVREKGNLVKTFNANCDPSKLYRNLAQLKTGIYQFRKGRHRNRIDAFRAYPEGIRLPCKRQNRRGVWYNSNCRYINIHDGGMKNTWSAGCLTIINVGKHGSRTRQFDEFRDLVYRLMDKHNQKLVTVALIDNKEMSDILKGVK